MTSVNERILLRLVRPFPKAGSVSAVREPLEVCPAAASAVVRALARGSKRRRGVCLPDFSSPPARGEVRCIAPPADWVWAREPKQESLAFDFPIPLASELRVAAAETKDMPLYLRTFVRLLSSWVRQAHGLRQTL